MVHLGFDLFIQRHLAFAEDLLDVGTQFARLRIDDLKLFLDPESEDVIGRAHARTTTANSRPGASCRTRRPYGPRAKNPQRLVQNRVAFDVLDSSAGPATRGSTKARRDT